MKEIVYEYFTISAIVLRTAIELKLFPPLILVNNHQIWKVYFVFHCLFLKHDLSEKIVQLMILKDNCWKELIIDFLMRETLKPT